MTVSTEANAPITSGWGATGTPYGRRCFLTSAKYAEMLVPQAGRLVHEAMADVDGGIVSAADFRPTLLRRIANDPKCLG